MSTFFFQNYDLLRTYPSPAYLQEVGQLKPLCHNMYYNMTSNSETKWCALSG